MGFHRLSVLLHHSGDWRREECTGSRRYTGYPEKHRRRSCVEIYRPRHKSPVSIVLRQRCYQPAHGEKLVAQRGEKCFSVRLAEKNQKNKRTVRWVCLWVCLSSHSAIPHMVNWWRALASQGFPCVYVWPPRMLWFSTSAALTQTYMSGNLQNNPSLIVNLRSRQCDEDDESCDFSRWLLCSPAAASLHFSKCAWFPFREKWRKESSSDQMDEFAGHQWFIVQRRDREKEREGERGRPHFKAFLLFPKWGWKSAAWLSPNKWLLLPFQSTQRPNPRTTWATNVDSDWDHHSMCQTLLTTHKTHWLQLYEVKMAQKGKMWRRCPQSFLPKKGHSIWAFNGKIKPKDRVE